MQTENTNVDADQVVTTTPIPADHADNLHKIIEEFFNQVTPSECLRINTRLLNAYIEKEGEYTHEHIQDAVYIMLQQAAFLIELSEGYEKYSSSLSNKITVPSTKPTVPS